MAPKVIKILKEEQERQLKQAFVNRRNLADDATQEQIDLADMTAAQADMILERKRMTVDKKDHEQHFLNTYVAYGTVPNEAERQSLKAYVDLSTLIFDTVHVLTPGTINLFNKLHAAAVNIRLQNGLPQDQNQYPVHHRILSFLDSPTFKRNQSPEIENNRLSAGQQPQHLLEILRDLFKAKNSNPLRILFDIVTELDGLKVSKSSSWDRMIILAMLLGAANTSESLQVWEEEMNDGAVGFITDSGQYWYYPTDHSAKQLALLRTAVVTQLLDPESGFNIPNKDHYLAVYLKDSSISALKLSLSIWLEDDLKREKKAAKAAEADNSDDEESLQGGDNEDYIPRQQNTSEDSSGEVVYRVRLSPGVGQAIPVQNLYDAAQSFSNLLFNRFPDSKVPLTDAELGTTRAMDVIIETGPFSMVDGFLVGADHQVTLNSLSPHELSIYQYIMNLPAYQLDDEFVSVKLGAVHAEDTELFKSHMGSFQSPDVWITNPTKVIQSAFRNAFGTSRLLLSSDPGGRTVETQMASTGHVVQIGVGFEAVICRLQKRISTLQSFRDRAIDQLEAVVELRSLVAAAELDLVEYVAGDVVVAKETLRLENLVLAAEQELEARLKEFRASARM
ncbi:hypothetical protein HDU79_001169, partial [Rhizoclosmatium sp. JEL0117]